ncbi:MAG TPA: ElyC/SanA/YdcF family protein [Thermoanaerobaculia bacterium]|nr:ElyC/SanA/YdcF family protein [Thermoanaerobaculia bacterium]
MARNALTAERVTTVALVCGYDLHSDLHEYVGNVVPVIDETRPHAIVFSGGFTSPVHDDSEAQAMTRILAQHVPNALVVLEERAMTTLDNIVYGRTIADALFHATHYVVICDRVHAAKVRALSALLLRARSTVRPVGRKVPLSVMVFEPLSIVIEVLAAIFPLLRRPLRYSAMWMKGLSEPWRRSARRAAA